MADNPIKDLGKIAKPITKLIEAIGSAAAVLYEPIRIKKKAKAESFAIKEIARAKVDALKIIDQNLRDYYFQLEVQELQRKVEKKENRDRIIRLAAGELENKIVDEKEVEKDWINEFLSIAENISNDEMQVIWAKLLAGEIQKPSSFSKRALHTLRLLSTPEARALKIIGELSMRDKLGNVLFPNSLMGNYFKEKYGEYGLHRQTEQLSNLGLLTVYNFPKKIVFSEEPTSILNFQVQNYVVQINTNRPVNKDDVSIQGQKFTSLGLELLQLITENPERSYVKDLCECIKKILVKKNIKASHEIKLAN